MDEPQKFSQISCLQANNSWRRVRIEPSSCALLCTHMVSLNHLKKGQLIVSSSRRIKMKLGESLIHPSFFSEKTTELTLLTQCTPIDKIAIGLPLGGLDKGMSQHYSTQDEARSLLHAEARAVIKMKKDEKSMLFVFTFRTTRCKLQLSVRPYCNYKLITYCLETYLL